MLEFWEANGKARWNAIGRERCLANGIPVDTWQRTVVREENVVRFIWNLLECSLGFFCIRVEPDSGDLTSWLSMM